MYDVFPNGLSYKSLKQVCDSWTKNLWKCTNFQSFNSTNYQIGSVVVVWHGNTENPKVLPELKFKMHKQCALLELINLKAKKNEFPLCTVLPVRLVLALPMVNYICFSRIFSYFICYRLTSKSNYLNWLLKNPKS